MIKIQFDYVAVTITDGFVLAPSPTLTGLLNVLAATLPGYGSLPFELDADYNIARGAGTRCRLYLILIELVGVAGRQKNIREIPSSRPKRGASFCGLRSLIKGKTVQEVSKHGKLWSGSDNYNRW
jgi:hypothetical protein